jgi:hypothetical protein
MSSAPPVSHSPPDRRPSLYTLHDMPTFETYGFDRKASIREMHQAPDLAGELGARG